MDGPGPSVDGPGPSMDGPELSMDGPGLDRGRNLDWLSVQCPRYFGSSRSILESRILNLRIGASRV